MVLKLNWLKNVQMVNYLAKYQNVHLVVVVG